MSNIEKNLFKLYIFLLPITCIDLFNGKLYSLTTSISAVVNVIGIIYLFIKFINGGKIKTSPAIRYLSIIIVLLNISSIIMAALLYKKLGVFIGRTTFLAILPHIAYYFQILLVFYYNYLYLSAMETEEIKKWIEYSLIFMLLIGYVQIVIILTKNSALTNIVMKLQDIFMVKSLFFNTYRVTLMGREASEAGAILATFIMPYLFSNIIVSRKKLKYIILALLFVPMSIYAESSTFYIGLIISVIYFVIYYCKKSYKFKIGAQLTAIVSVIVLLISVILMRNGVQLYEKNKDTDTKGFVYLTTSKLMDEDNLSTIHRYSSIYTNWQAVKRYPILGVGNGNQGFFYRIYFPKWAAVSEESKGYYYGELGWPGSGAFLPTYISSYGIFGVILLIIYIVFTEANVKKLINTDKEFFYYMYKIGVLSFIPLSITAINITGIMYILFILSIPFIEVNKKNC